MSTVRANVRRAVACLAAVGALLTGAVAVPGSASASTVTTVALIPNVAPRVDVALGAEFPLSQRDNSGLSLAEQWDVIQPDGADFVYLKSRHLVGGQAYMMDSQAPGQGTPSTGDPVGARPADSTLSQRWKMVKLFDGSVTLRNSFSGLVLTWNGTGVVPAYVQKAAGSPFQDFTVKQLS